MTTSARRRLDRLWPDVPRPLKAREQFRVADSMESGKSGPAFIAWKAFLQVAWAEEHDSNGAASEPALCRRSLELSCEAFPDEFLDPMRRFVEGLQGFLEVQPYVVADWFISHEEQQRLRREVVEAEVAKRVRAIKSLGRSFPSATSSNVAGFADEVGSFAYCVRNAVIGHAAVMSMGTLFIEVVPAFEELVATAAAAGWARRGGVSYRDAQDFIYG